MSYLTQADCLGFPSYNTPPRLNHHFELCHYQYPRELSTKSTLALPSIAHTHPFDCKGERNQASTSRNCSNPFSDPRVICLARFWSITMSLFVLGYVLVDTTAITLSRLPPVEPPRFSSYRAYHQRKPRPVARPTCRVIYIRQCESSVCASSHQAKASLCCALGASYCHQPGFFPFVHLRAHLGQSRSALVRQPCQISEFALPGQGMKPLSPIYSLAAWSHQSCRSTSMLP